MPPLPRTPLLTPRLLTLARSWLTGVPLWEFALPHMRAVAEALNESCSAAVLADTDVVYVARVPGERIMSVSLCSSTPRTICHSERPIARAASTVAASVEPTPE